MFVKLPTIKNIELMRPIMRELKTENLKNISGGFDISGESIVMITTGCIAGLLIGDYLEANSVAGNFYAADTQISALQKQNSSLNQAVKNLSANLKPTHPVNVAQVK